MSEIEKWKKSYCNSNKKMSELLKEAPEGQFTEKEIKALLEWAGEVTEVNMRDYVNDFILRNPDIYAVDFDGTISLGAEWPQVGKINVKLLEFLKERKKAGDKVILWTCRTGNYLKTAVKVCNAHGLFFDSINNNLQENIERYGNNTRKVYATYYIDDKCISPFDVSLDNMNCRLV